VLEPLLKDTAMLQEAEAEVERCLLLAQEEAARHLEDELHENEGPTTPPPRPPPPSPLHASRSFICDPWVLTLTPFPSPPAPLSLPQTACTPPAPATPASGASTSCTISTTSSAPSAPTSTGRSDTKRRI
jgi:hypothetical protein